MSHRYVCPSVGAVGRPLSQRVAASSRCARGFHASVGRLEDQPGSAPPRTKTLKDAMIAPREPRRLRNASAAQQVGTLSFNRPPSAGTVLARRSGTGPPDGAKIMAPRKPLIRREAVGPAGPPGTMVRAPSTFGATRNGGPPTRRPQGGPNLRARGGGPPGANGARGPGGSRGPGSSRGPGGARGPAKKSGGKGASAKRERRGGAAADSAPEIDKEGIAPGAIEGSMMQTLYRQQRNQWDRKPYEPKYAPGSFAANELIHAGRELFRGEAPPVKIWGKLERTLNIVGMHGAAAHLKVRRVPDGDSAPFGDEEENLLKSKQNGAAEQKTITIA
ncbi:hypothetical protein PMIN06_005898 [Paraphaeosphaeria minitans]